MSTNKRKDSAALFELIDKSTLKVPKTTGQLKIPSWWSSKTNPPATATTETEPDPTIKVTSRPITNEPIPSALASRLAKRENSGLVSAPVTPTPGTPAAAAAKAAPPVPDPQHRLFDPHAHPEESPSIRPPASAATSDAPAETPEIAATAESAPLPEMTPAPSPEPSAHPEPAVTPHLSIAPPVPAAYAPPAATVGPTITAPAPEAASAAPPPSVPHRLPSGVFAPQSVDRATIARHNWMNSQRSSLARIPSWAVVAVACTGVVLVILAIYLMIGKNPTTPSTQTTVNTNRTGPEIQQPVMPPTVFQPTIGVPAGSPIKPPANNSSNTNNVAPPNPNQGTQTTAVQPGKVYNPGEYPWNPDLLYLYIAASGSAEITKRNAEFLAEHGVSVGIEKNSRGLYQLIATEGFKAIGPETSKFRNMVVITVGRDHPDYKRNRRDVWSDAMFGKIKVSK